MKTETFKRPRRAFWRRPCARLQFAALVAGTLLAAGNLMAMPEVTTLTGGPSQFYPQTAYGYVDGFTDSDAKFHTPLGLALDSAGLYLFVADRDNNAVRWLDLAGDQTYTFVPNAYVSTNLISKPVGVAVDVYGNVYVLNRGNGNNGTVLQFDTFGELVLTNATGLTNAAAMALDGAANLYLTVQSNKLIRIAAGTTNQTLIPASFPAGTSLQGIVVKRNGLIAACDSGRNGIYLINPNTGVVTTNAGFHGAGDFTTANNVASSGTAMFNQPYGVAEAGDGTLVVADTGNHRVKVVLTTGVVTNLYGVSSNLWYGPANPSQGIFPGWYDGTVTVPDLYGGEEARQPVGVVFATDGTVYTTETYYHLIRKVTSTGLPPPPPPPPQAPTILTVVTNYGQVSLTWSTVTGATNYNVKRSTSTNIFTTIASTSGTSYTDNNVLNGTTYYYVVSASNAGGEGPNSSPVSATPPLPPVPDPQIGYVDFPATSTPIAYTSVFHPVSSFVFNNDALIVILGAAGSQTFYTYGNTPTNGSIPDPTSSSSSAPVGYQDGLTQGQVSSLYAIAQILPDLTIKAIGEKNDGSPNSAIVTARFQFVVGNPLIVGDNAAQFTVSDITTGATLWYTTDGSDPTNAAPSQSAGTISGTNAITLSVSFPPGVTNMTVKFRGFKANYQPSGVVSAQFSAANFNANKISFGFASGEASSDFVASPGQYFYAPVTLSILPSARMYSLQFNLTVTNGGTNPGPALASGAFGFESFLEKPIPNTTPVIYEHIPPLSFSGYQSNPPPPSAIVYYDNLPFVNMLFTNTTENLLGVGWLERYTQTNLYNTISQDLIKYSQPHDTLFLEDNGQVVVGGYAFRVPGAAQIGDTYQIQIGRPSATSDGVGAPGGNVYIAAPTNGSLYAGDINAIKVVTVGQRKYLVGDAAPFRWFNAGDFGNTNLLSDDVMQVFQSAIYNLNYPPFGSDFFDGMDSCGNFGVLDGDNADPNFGYYTNSNPIANTTGLSTAQLNALFDGNDTTIDQVAFGDGTLDVCDVYVTFRRSLDPSRTWFRRFWNNGVRVADTIPNAAPISSIMTKGPTQPKSKNGSSSPDSPKVNFAAGDSMPSAGQTVQIPVTAQIFGAYPLKVLMLNLTVAPLDGSPGPTSPVQFIPNAALGQPTLVSSVGNANYAATWLNSSISGFTGNATLGTLTVQIPASASANSAYAIHFDHASGSPNGIASFPKQAKTGLITLSDRSASSYGDGIPDSWRLRWFGTIYNVLSAANADACGDGINNWHKYIAGTDPTDPKAYPHLNPKAPVPAGATAAIHWPTVNGKQYVIERSMSLFSGSWSAISTNTGTGTDMEFDDAAGGSAVFYRVRILP